MKIELDSSFPIFKKPFGLPDQEAQFWKVQEAQKFVEHISLHTYPNVCDQFENNMLVEVSKSFAWRRIVILSYYVGLELYSS